MSITGVRVKLVGADGNSFAIMARVDGAMRRAGVSKEIRDAYRNEAMSGDYDNLLRTTLKYVEDDSDDDYDDWNDLDDE